MAHFRLAIVLFTICLLCKSCTGQEVVRVNQQQLKDHAIGKNVQLVDVRTSKEYEQGHIEGALNFDVMDRKKFMDQIEKLDKNTPVYLYCKSGVRSRNAAELLKLEGFDQIFDYSGGYDDWKKSKK
ncbi:rhodanese-like domain-containing protein [Flagellimonas sp.]|uniref:rhodanese-like domain-containing protein n=1 Tax=Flagellimonas sp. TaxID=2058762 RepID=UPI003F4A60BF